MKSGRLIRKAARAGLAAPAIFGSFDGTASLLGVTVFLLIRHPALAFPAALAGALGSALSMAAGEWLSDSGSGLAASAVMGTATFTGALLPAVPFAFGTGPVAVAMLAVICLAISSAVAFMRPGRSRPLALAETIGLLILVAAAVLACSLAFPAGSGA